MNCLDFMRDQRDKSIDLIFSDPPWGYEYNGQDPHGINQQTHHEERENYNDKFDPEFCLQYWKECCRIAERVVLCVGWIHFNWWITNTDPLSPPIILTFPNGQNSTKTSRYNGTIPYLCWGNFKDRSQKFYKSYYETFIQNGFLRDGFNVKTDSKRMKKLFAKNTQLVKWDREEKKHHFIHPSPKDFSTWYRLLKDLHPKTIYDPFAGSCPIGEVGEALQTTWIGTELEPKYLPDIDYRIHRGMEFIHPTIQTVLTEMTNQ